MTTPVVGGMPFIDLNELDAVLREVTFETRRYIILIKRIKQSVSNAFSLPT